MVIGGGFSGTTAAYEFNKQRKARPDLSGPREPSDLRRRGEAERVRRGRSSPGRAAGIERRARGEEGDHITGRYETYAEYYRELGMPSHYDLEPLAGGAEKYNLPNDHFDPMMLERQYPTGYFFKGHGWAANPIAAGFANTPWPAAVRRKRSTTSPTTAAMSFPGRRMRIDGSTPSRTTSCWTSWATAPRSSATSIRCWESAISASAATPCPRIAAKRLTLPGTIPSNTPNRFVDVSVVSFPGGNAAILRKMWARMLPEAISGDGSLAAVATGAVNFAALDREGSRSACGCSRQPCIFATTGIRERGFGARDVCAGWKAVSRTGQSGRHGLGRLGQPQYRADLPASHVRGIRAISLWPRADGQRRACAIGATSTSWDSSRRVGSPGLGWHVCVRRNVALRPGAPPLTPDSPHRPDFLHSDAATRSRSDRHRAWPLARSCCPHPTRSMSGRCANRCRRCSGPPASMRGAISPASCSIAGAMPTWRPYTGFLLRHRWPAGAARGHSQAARPHLLCTFGIAGKYEHGARHAGGQARGAGCRGVLQIMNRYLSLVECIVFRGDRAASAWPRRNSGRDCRHRAEALRAIAGCACRDYGIEWGLAE